MKANAEAINDPMQYLRVLRSHALHVDIGMRSPKDLGQIEEASTDMLMLACGAVALLSARGHTRLEERPFRDLIEKRAVFGQSQNHRSGQGMRL